VKTIFHWSLQQVCVEALKTEGRRYTSTPVLKIIPPLVFVKGKFLVLPVDGGVDPAQAGAGFMADNDNPRDPAQ
jgi:hypothetical protein